MIVWALNVLVALLLGYLWATQKKGGGFQVVIQWAICDEPRMRTIGIQVRSGALC